MSPFTEKNRYNHDAHMDNLDAGLLEEFVECNTAQLDLKNSNFYLKEMELASAFDGHHDAVCSGEAKMKQLEDQKRSADALLRCIDEQRSSHKRDMSHHDDKCRNIQSDAKRNAEEQKVVKWLLLFSTDKPYATWNMLQIQHHVGLTNPEKVKTLSYEGCLAKLQRMKNLGLGEHLDFPNDDLLTGKGNDDKNDLQNRIIRYLALDYSVNSTTQTSSDDGDDEEERDIDRQLAELQKQQQQLQQRKKARKA